MQPHQQRVVDEYNQTSERVTKLSEFIRGDVYPKLPEAEQDRLRRQELLMTGLVQILAERIAAFPIDPPAAA